MTAEEPTSLPGLDRETDQELAALPEPRHPWRRATFAAMALATAGSLFLSVNLVPELVYALSSGVPVELGQLSNVSSDVKLENRWVHAEGELSADRAIRYQRPLETDSYRLAQASDNPKIWVQVRVPEHEEGPRFVPPASFVGRLVKVKSASIRQEGLADAVAEAGLGALPADTWLLIDDEAPATMRWIFGLVALLLTFAIFNVWGMLKLAKPIPKKPA